MPVLLSSLPLGELHERLCVSVHHDQDGGQMTTLKIGSTNQPGESCLDYLGMDLSGRRSVFRNQPATRVKWLPARAQNHKVERLSVAQVWHTGCSVPRAIQTSSGSISVRDHRVKVVVAVGSSCTSLKLRAHV